MNTPTIQEKPKKWIDRSLLGRWLRLLVSKGSVGAKLDYMRDIKQYDALIAKHPTPTDLDFDSAGSGALSEEDFARRCLFPSVKFKPYLTEKHASSGNASGHYFHQDLYVARQVFQNKPERHLDIGSRVDGFIAHVASFREIEVGDIRPGESNIPGVVSRVVDITDASKAPSLQYDSISCLHTIEHIGLGRYGDPIDPHGHIRALQNLITMVQPGGRLYLSAPIGPQRVEFNGKRVFDPETLPRLARSFEPALTLESFAFVDDAGDLHEGFDVQDGLPAACFNCRYGLGIYVFRR